METVRKRKPILKPKPSGKFQMAEFQREDIGVLSEMDECALWNEMGTFKTTTAEWLWEQKLKHIPNPRVLVITTKTGKGAYLESLHEVIPEWDSFVATAKGFQMIVGGKVITRYNKHVKLPNPLYFRPVVVLAHYHCFTNRACLPQEVKETVVINGKEVKRNKMEIDPITGEQTGLFEMKVPVNNELMTKHWDLIVIDEGHRIKNPDSQWTRNIKKLKSPHKIIMTGTGFVNNPSEIWSLLDWLYSGRKNSPHAEIVGGTGYWKFREYFCDEEVVSGYRKVVGINPLREDEFRELVRRVGVRRTMIECFPHIKEPITSEVQVALSPAQRKMYDGIVAYLSALDAQGVPLHSPTVLSALTRCRQISVATPKVLRDEWDEKQDRRVIEVELTEPSSKLDAAMEIIEGLEWDAERRDQVVVFSCFRQPLYLLKARLEKAGITYLHMTADMSETQRFDLWHEKWWTGDYQVFLCTLGVGSESINLSKAHRAIFLDQDWSPAKNKQAIGRVYRPGQTGAVQLIYIRAEDTVDYRVLDKVNEKHGWFKSIFGGQDTDDSELTNGNGDDDEDS
jgi:SNF2 family DNA or RNA helicase